jgi:lysophospholipase L1-like esterase
MYGTSLTAERHLLLSYASGGWVANLRAELERRYPGLATVTNRARHGMTSAWGLKNLRRRVLSQHPDVVFIEFSANDAADYEGISLDTSRAHLVAMVDGILEHHAGAEIILLTMNVCIGPHAEARQRLPEYYQVYRDVARERGFPLIDLEPVWRELLEQDPVRFDQLLPDGIHPNRRACNEVITPHLHERLFGGWP